MYSNSTPFPLDSILIPAGVISVIVPIWKLSYRMKKRSVDLYYSLPLSHTRILVVKILVGLIAVFVPYTLAYWIGSFTAMGAITAYWKAWALSIGAPLSTAYKTLNNVTFLPLYFATLIPMLIIYFLTAFLFTRANRFVDGLAFVALAGLSLMMIIEVVSEFTYESSIFINSLYYTPMGPLVLVWEHFAINIFKSGLSENLLHGLTPEPQDIVGLVLVAACAVAAGVGLFISERKVKAENSEQISNSYFGYKTMIPLYSFCLAFLAALDYYVLVALSAAAVFAASVLYKRTPKIGWKFAVVIGVAFIAGVACSFILYD